MLDNQVYALPVNITKIANDNGVTILKNSEYETSMLEEKQAGKSIYDKSENKWIIIYDDTMKSLGRKRFTIAHELAHIFLGHPLTKDKAAFKTKFSIENEANVFASRLLAPACVLWGLDIHTAEDIMKVCNISYTAAKIRAERMAALYKRNKFLTSALERKVYEQFKPFIEMEKSNY